MIEQVLTDKGVVLMGEVANRYITYKYFDSILAFLCVLLIIGGIGWLIYKILGDL